MNLPKAIEILTEWHWPDSTHPWADMETAMGLGIEALERVLLYRKGMYIGLGDKMPGETKD